MKAKEDIDVKEEKTDLQIAVEKARNDFVGIESVEYLYNKYKKGENNE